MKTLLILTLILMTTPALADKPRVGVVAETEAIDPLLSSFCENQIASILLAGGCKVIILPFFLKKEGLEGNLGPLAERCDLLLFCKAFKEEIEIKMLNRKILRLGLTARVISVRDGTILATEEADVPDPFGRKQEALKKAVEKLTFKLIKDIRKTEPLHIQNERDLPPVVIKEVFLQNIFPSRINSYLSNPLGSVTIENNTDHRFERVKLSFFIPGFMSLPYEVMMDLKPKTETTISIAPSLMDDEVAKIEENIPISSKITVVYYERGERKEESLTQTIAIFNRNAIDWKEQVSVASFITPKDEVIRAYTNYAIDFIKEIKMPQNLALAASIFELLSLSSIMYLGDPVSHYQDRILDYVQYPKETLKTKRGDCDDLSVLYASCLESIGIRTRLVSTPTHIFPIFDAGIHPKNAHLVSLNKEMFIISDNKIWIPVETTAIDGSFITAWDKGIANYRNQTCEIIDTWDAWKTYPPILLPSSKEEIPLPSFTNELNQRIKKVSLEFKEREEKIYQAMLTGYQKEGHHNSIGILHSRMGYYDLAEEEFKKGLAISSSSSLHNNLGNIYCIKNLFSQAEEEYKNALTEDFRVFCNISILYYLQGKMDGAIDALKKIEEPIGSIYGIIGLIEKEEGFLGEKEGLSEEEFKRLIKEALGSLPAKPVEKETNTTRYAGIRGHKEKEERLCEWLYWKE